jgi:Tol biopolymer transport system component
VQTISGSGGWGIFNANSHEVVEFNLGDDQVFPLALAWNPIEPKLAVFLSGGRNQVSDELGILDFTTGKIHQITNTAACEGNTVKWSPDGQKLAFISWDKNSEVFVANADGSSMFNLTSSPFAHEFDVDWSSTDSRLAFVRFEASDGGTYSQDIYIQNANGTAARLLIDTPDADEFLPVWSPDGSMIAYWSMVADSSKGSGYARLNIVNSDGTGHKSIAEFP